ncbi:MAG: hypothetical protein ABI232_03395 [Jatrophihabitantaceae bacterium]
MATLTAQHAIASYLATVPDPTTVRAPAPEVLSASQVSTAAYRFSRPMVAAAAFAAVVVALLITVSVVSDSAYKHSIPTTPVQGLTIFAVFFVAAAAIERLLEPLASLLPDTSDLRAQAHAKTVAAGKALVEAPTASGEPLTDAANAISDASFATYWRTVGFWALATIIALIASACLHLYFLRAVGIATGPRALEVLATGLIIGSGTKPLHDLVGLISQASTTKS